MNSWKVIKKVFIGIVVAFILFIGLIVIPYFANIVMPWQKANAIETTLEWGRLANLPESADDISISTTGGMFTRSFTLEFFSNEKDIEEWVEKSYGLIGAQPTVYKTGITEYQVKGQQGAIGGKVIIDKRSEKVIIYMYWS